MSSKERQWQGHADYDIAINNIVIDLTLEFKYI